MKAEWLIYGANGYSAQLAAEKAVEQGLRPILAGRNKAVIEALAARLGLQARVFDLSSVDVIAKHLGDVKVVSHCAGPFSATAAPMMKACIQAGTHYTDINGEIDVFESAQALDEAAKRAGVVLCGGVGFDVIPTDCLANYLVRALPDATQLTLGFDGSMSMSPGTAKTTVENLSQGMKVRRDGKLLGVGRGFEMRTIDFGHGERLASVIPWGDLSTAYWQTKIPNISVYMPSSGGKLGIVLFPVIKGFLGILMIQDFVKKKIEARVKGPSEKARAAGETAVWGEVKNALGKTVTARITVPNGYTVTMDGIIITAKFLLDYHGDGGCFTPSQIMGYELAQQLPGASEFTLS